MYEIEVVHSIDAGHRVVGHENGKGKCARLHGHTYGFTVSLRGWKLDDVGFIVDFAAVKGVLDEWDHRLILWSADPLMTMTRTTATEEWIPEWHDALDGVVVVGFNPTAENMSRHLCTRFFELPGVEGVRVEVRETAKSMARYAIGRNP